MKCDAVTAVSRTRTLASVSIQGTRLEGSYLVEKEPNMARRGAAK